MRPNHVLAKVFFILMFFIVSGCSAQSPVEKTLKDAIKAYGGKDNLEKLNSWTAVWNVQAKARGESGTDTRNIGLPDRLMVHLDYGTSSETRDGALFQEASLCPRRALLCLP